MKKLIALCLVLIFLGTVLFADDAKVMPAMVGRFYLAPSYIFGSNAFDKDGKSQKTGQDISMLNLGMALEFGVISWITAAVQWAPGINLWSEIDAEGSPMKMELADMGDLFVGAKIQIAGTEAPVKTDKIRLSFAPGVKIPLPGPDFEEEVKSMFKEETFTPAKLDNHVLGLGLRSYFDFIINDNFFINLHNEIIYYPIKGDMKDASIQHYATLAGVNAHPLLPPNGSVSGEVDYGLDLKFEIEPVFTMPLEENTIFTAGLPITYTTSSASYEYIANGVNGSHYVDAAKQQLPLEEERSHLLTVGPNVAVFFRGWPLPMEFRLSYIAPIWGKYDSANHIINLQARMYFKF